MENHLILEPAKKIREIARKALAGYWKPMFVGIFIYYFFTTGMQSILDCFFYYDLPTTQFSQYVETKAGYGGKIYLFLVEGAFSFGLSIFLLTFFRKKKIQNTLIFEGFGIYGKAFVLFFYISLKVFLWSLLFVIPGIIAAIRYSQSFFVMADHPSYSIIECVKESKRLMMGNKGRYLFLSLSFIGWLLLASIPVSAYSFTLDNQLTGVLINLLLSIPTVFVVVYIQTAYVVFYELASNNLVVVQETPQMFRDEY